MQNKFPTTEVAGIVLPRLIIGCNWISGFSHRSASSDAMINRYHNAPDPTAGVLEAFLEYDVNAVLGLFAADPNLLKAVKLAEERTNKQIILMDEPTINTEDTPSARREAQKIINECAKRGAKFCLPLHSCIEQLVNKGKQTIDRLPDYLYMIREAGMIPGLSAHMPEIIQYADANEYDVETYIQIFNCMGFLMQIEIESVASIIHYAKKPVITIKPLAAGRTTPYVGLTFSWNAIRKQDMVCLGCLHPDEVHEDIEISYAALERRLPQIKHRCSPNVTSVIKGGTIEK